MKMYMPEVSNYYNYSKDEIIEELKETKKSLYKLETVVENLADGIFIADGNTEVICVNLAYEKISGTERRKFIGKTVYEIVNEGLINESGTLKVIEENKPISMRQRLNNGKIALITSTPIYNSLAEIEYIVTIVRDITDLIELRNKIIEKENLILELKQNKINCKDLVYKSYETEKILNKAKKVAKYDSTVLITGETGSGKGVLANFIHRTSLRKNNTFIQLNCATIPSNLIESELFGYEAGSFTGSSSTGKKGIFEQANRGTLFLDEIAELPFDMQSKLLSAIQDKKIRKIGSDRETEVDVRIITATNRDLKLMVKEGLFREDLYYRLNVVPIETLPLKKRKDDIIALTELFIKKLERKYKRDMSIDKEVLHVFYNYDWPGNVRELENLIERLFVLNENKIISTKDLPKNMTIKDNNHIELENTTFKKAVYELEANLIQNALNREGTSKAAAKLLDLTPSTFTRKRQKYIKEGYLK